MASGSESKKRGGGAKGSRISASTAAKRRRAQVKEWMAITEGAPF